MLPLLQKLKSFLKSHAWDESDTVSTSPGGPDSVALFRGLHELYPNVRLVLAQSEPWYRRGPESDADEAFVAALPRTEKNELHCIAWTLRRRQPPTRATWRRWHGDCAMNRLLAEVAAETGCRWLVTGHNADDQAETVLHGLLRGSGLRGLRGIAPQKRLTPTLTLLRPLLDVTRSEIVEFLNAHHAGLLHRSHEPRLRFTRNRIRHELLPCWRRNSTRTSRSCSRTSRPRPRRPMPSRKRELAELLVRAERRRSRGAPDLRPRRSGSGTAQDLVRELFRLVWLREDWPENDMTFDAWDRLAAVGRGETSAADLPGGIHARAHARVVQLGPRS